MKDKTVWLFRTFAFLALIILAACTRATTTPQPESTATLSVQVDERQVGPQIVAQQPPAGARLDLSPVIRVVFDREMDQKRTAAAWRLLDPNGEPVEGEAAWPDARTFEFRPASKLAPSSAYIGTFSLQAAGADGVSLLQVLRLRLETVDALAVGQVFPAADAEDVDGATNITVIFNRPVVPLHIKEEQASLPQPLEFSPALEGAGEWVNASVYVFQPEKTLIGGVRYTARVSPGLKDVTGNALEKPYLWQFSTRAPAIGRFALIGGPENPGTTVNNVRLDQGFTVSFLQPMDAGSVAKAVSLVNRETGKSFPLRLKWNKDFTQLAIEPIGRYQVASFYDLKLDASARAIDGGSLREGLAIGLNTLPLPRINKVTPSPNARGGPFDSSISIAFASPMRFDSLKGRVLISPQLRGEPQWYYSDYDWALRIYGLQPGTEYVVRVLPGMSDIYGNTIRSEFSYSFTTGDLDSYARLVLPWTPLVYRLHGAQEVYFEYTNLLSARISLYRIKFEDFGSLSNDQSSIVNFVPAGQPLREWHPDVGGQRNHTAHIKLELKNGGGYPLEPGYYFIGVREEPVGFSTAFYQAGVFIVATDNVTFKATSTEGLAWVVDLESGKPQANVPVQFYDENLVEVGKAATDAHGLAYLEGIKSPVYARVEGTGHLALAGLNWGSGVSAGDFGISENYYGGAAGPFVYLYTERPLYRPGQEVFFKGILRENDDLHYTLSERKQVHVVIANAGEQVYEADLPVSAPGSFSGTFKLAEAAALGTYSISVGDRGSEGSFGALSFRVADYHKPEFAVSVSPDKPAILRGEAAEFHVDSSYYSGGHVAAANVEWYVDASPYYFSPAPAFGRFSFDDWDRDTYWSPQHSTQKKVLAQGKVVSDANGHVDVSAALGPVSGSGDMRVNFSANVTDVAGNLVSGTAGMVVHQSQVYAGIRSTSYVGRQGQAAAFDVVALDWDSNPVAGKNVSVRFAERRWYSVQEQDEQGQLRWITSVKEIPVTQKTVVTAEDGTAQVSFVPPSGGVYKAVATVRDAKGHTHQASTYIWVTSEKNVAWRQTNDRTFSLIADKDLYTPGETAEILIAQPFEGEVRALVTYERGHIYKRDVITLQGSSTVYKLPITEDMVPMAYVSVVVVSGAENTGKPEFKIGMARLDVDTGLKLLNVKITPDKRAAGPGDQVTYTVLTRDQNDKPVSADISVALVDKAVLALAPANSAPMLSRFYPEQSLSVHTALGIVLTAEDFNEQYRESVPEGGGSGGGGDAGLGIVTVRQDFKDTAFFKAQLITDANGRAQVTVTLPQNLTTWQAEVRAVTTDSRVGQATQELVSTKPLFVEVQTPRFFTAGDQARVGATVHNNLGEALKVNVSLEAQGVALASPAAQSVEIPAGQQGYVTWDLKVSNAAPRADLTVRAVSGGYADASKPALGTLPGQGIPIINYSVVETVGTSGMLRPGESATEGIRLPETLDYSNAGLSIELAPSLAASMQDGLTYLEDFPYLCMEQTVSRILPNVITARVLKAAGMPNPALQRDLNEQVNTALQRIYAKQGPDGGWNWWGSNKSDPQTSAYVVYGLMEARASAYAVDAGVLANGINFLKDNVPEPQINDDGWVYNRYAFVLYVLARGGDLQAGRTNFIYQHRTALSLYGKAYLAQALHLLDAGDPRIASLMSDLAAGISTSAAGAHWEEASVDYWNWNTDTRTTAIVLNAFILIDPDNPVTANGVRWLMAHRDAGHWASTQETTWSLIALTNWLTASKEFETDYAYALGLNGEQIRQGRASRDNLTETVQLQVQLRDLLKDEVNYLVLTHGEGTGNLYYTAYLKTTLPVESITPLDQGISLSRQYTLLDDPKTPVTEVGRGDLVKVRLTIVIPAAVYYVVIDDPLPAGLEAIDSSLATDTQVPTVYNVQEFGERGWGWWYFTHTELRDEKVVLSTEYLPAGTYVFTYLARASTAGTFKVVPPTAREFYFPDVAGRGAGSLFVVKP